MRRINGIFASTVLVMFFLRVDGVVAQQPTPIVRTPVKGLMEDKLESSQALIKGIALEDYELIHRNAQVLQSLNLDVGSNIIQTDDYVRLSVEFRKAAEQIKRAAKQENLDAVGLAYFKLTTTCIDCHRSVRAAKKRAKTTETKPSYEE